MSGSPKYSTVRISAERQLELAQRQAEARRLQAQQERQRQAEIRRRIEAERKERREHIERRRAELERQREERRAASAERIEAARAEREARRTTGRPAGEGATSRRESAPNRRERARDPDEQAAAYQDDPTIDELPSPVDERLAAALEALGMRSAAALAQAEVLIEQSARQPSAADRRGVLERARRAVERALKADDEELLSDALERLDAELEGAQRAYDVLVVQDARRRAIAAAVAHALPDHYVVHEDALMEGPEGSLHFAAYSLDQELHVAVVGDGHGGEVIAYEIDGATAQTYVENGVNVNDCPDLAADLEQAHDRLREDGFEPGILMWPDAPAKRRAPPPSSKQARRKER